MRLTLEKSGFVSAKSDWQRSDCQSNECPDFDLQVMCELHHLHLVWPQMPAESRREILNSIEFATRQS